MVKRNRISRLAVAAAVVLAVCLPAPAAALYDGSDTAHPLPADQGWAYGTDPLLGPSATQTPMAGGVRLDSSSEEAEKAGYFSEEPVLHSFSHPGVQTLSRTAGYTLTFDVKVNAESHSSDDRAGFSVIAISSDLMGIELGFWEDKVFAQTAGFAHAEDANAVTTSMTRYELEVAGSNYTLRAGGATSPLLSGALRDYSPASVPTPDVYEIPSFLFLGDDTKSAGASVDIAYIELVPEPATLSIVLAGAVALLRRRAGRLSTRA